MSEFTVEWKKGPPPGKGNWWVKFENGPVVGAAVEPAYIHRHDPDAGLLFCWMGASPAARFERAALDITHHAKMGTPARPKVKRGKS